MVVRAAVLLIILRRVEPPYPLKLRNSILKLMQSFGRSFWYAEKVLEIINILMKHVEKLVLFMLGDKDGALRLERW